MNYSKPHNYDIIIFIPTLFRWETVLQSLISCFNRIRLKIWQLRIDIKSDRSNRHMWCFRTITPQEEWCSLHSSLKCKQKSPWTLLSPVLFKQERADRLKRIQEVRCFLIIEQKQSYCKLNVVKHDSTH